MAHRLAHIRFWYQGACCDHLAHVGRRGCFLSFFLSFQIKTWLPRLAQLARFGYPAHNRRISNFQGQGRFEASGPFLPGACPLGAYLRPCLPFVLLCALSLHSFMYFLSVSFFRSSVCLSVFLSFFLSVKLSAASISDALEYLNQIFRKAPYGLVLAAY